MVNRKTIVKPDFYIYNVYRLYITIRNSQQNFGN